MKFEQKREFHPVVITLETPDEVNALWGVIVPVTKSSSLGVYSESERRIAIQLCNHFTNDTAQ